MSKIARLLALVANVLLVSSTQQGLAEEQTGRVPHVIAHRGGKKWAPENTMAGFKKSLDHNVFGIEFDIHRCKSGELVVIHDHDLKRTTDGQGLVKDHTLAELRKLSAGNWYSPEFKDERIPSLAEVLKLADGKMVLNIEIKNSPVAYPNIEADLIAELKDYKYPDKIIISSFDHQVLQRLHKKAPHYKIALLGDSIFAELPTYASLVGATLWHPDFGETRKDAVDEAHSHNVEVNVWTLNDTEQWHAAVGMGVDGIVTDDPVGLHTYLSSVASKP